MRRVCRTATAGRRRALAGQRHQPADRPEVLLAVAALQQRLREQPVERHAARDHRQGPVVEPVGEHHEPQRDGLVVDGAHVLQADGAHPVEQGAVLRGVDRRQVPEQVDEVVEAGVVGLRGPLHRVEVRRGRRLRHAPVPVVLAVDAHRLERRREALDLAEEVLGGEPALAQPPGSVFDVAAMRTPASRSRVSSVETSTVSPGSSSSNSSTQTSACGAARRRPRGTQRADQVVSSTKVANSLGRAAACHSEASRCVLPTPYPPSR